MADREVYPNAPLRLVTAEFRFPLSPRLTSSDLLTLLADVLGERLPIIEPAGLQVTIGHEAAPPAVSGMGYRLLTRERTTAVTVGSSRIAVETTAYEHWEDFRDGVVSAALRAIGDDLGALAGLDRVGLRYINEIRVPGAGEDVTDWGDYIAPQLLAPAGLAAGQSIRTLQLALHLDRGDGAELLLRAGLLEGHVVDDTGSLQLLTPPQPGHFFLVDVDSFWTRSAAYEQWNTNAALKIANRLHDPIDELFESCITETLRAEVLRRQP
ncbi:MAG: TIGR04255 family protein [Actinomycetota bacterium]|nr:TIGR04255 family protein [Actinomycetota bacterium]